MRDTSITETALFDERRPTVDWPWIVFQRRSVSDPSAAWQLVSYNLVTAMFSDVDPTGLDQLDPAVHRGNVVWQDSRDAGPGEIYYKNLASGEVVRVTDDPGGQLQPTIFDSWIVWADNRDDFQLDLYGHHIEQGVVVQLSDTPQDESRPQLRGPWVVYTDDGSGEDP